MAKKKKSEESIENMVEEKKEFEKWLEQADIDFRAAKNSLKSGDYGSSVFWCQQSVEKGLKAMMIKEGKGLVKVHNLVRLGKEVGLPEKFFGASAKLSVLYTDARYPMFVEFEKSEVGSFIKFVEEVSEWIKKRI